MLIATRQRLRLLLLLAVAAALLVAGYELRTDRASAATFSGPITISAGGTYSGNWESSSSSPAVTVTTSQPVTIENCEVRGKGHLIVINAVADVTIRNCRGEGTWSGSAGSGRMVWAPAGVKNLVFENNEVVKAAALKVINARRRSYASWPGFCWSRRSSSTSPSRATPGSSPVSRASRSSTGGSSFG